MGASHISLTQRERQYLKVLADGDKARRTADRARILLLRADGMTIQDIAEKMELSTRTIQTRISRYRHKGLEAALFDNLHPGRPAEISPDAKEWLLDTARHTPTDLGCQWDSWTLKDLHGYIQGHAEGAGFPRLSTVTKVYLRKLLLDAEIIWG